MKIQLTICLLTLAGLAQTATAQSDTTKVRSTITPNNKNTVFPVALIQYFNGKWVGKGAFKNGKILESQYVFSAELGDQAIAVKHEEYAPYTYKFSALWSFDANSGDVVMLAATNRNGGARLFRSNEGWKDQKIIFQGIPELKAVFAFERFTFEAKSANIFKATYEWSGDGQIWNLGDWQEFIKTSN